MKTGPLFLARADYRRRRLRDAARLLPVVGALLMLLPLLWQGQVPEPGIKPVPEQIAEQTAEPGMEQSREPGTEQTAEPGTEQVREPGTEQAAQPGTELAGSPGTAGGGLYLFAVWIALIAAAAALAPALRRGARDEGAAARLPRRPSIPVPPVESGDLHAAAPRDRANTPNPSDRAAPAAFTARASGQVASVEAGQPDPTGRPDAL